MNVAEIKNSIIKEILDINNPDILENIQEHILYCKSNKTKPLLYTPEIEREEAVRGIEDMQNGRYTSNEEVLKMFG